MLIPLPGLRNVGKLFLIYCIENERKKQTRSANESDWDTHQWWFLIITLFGCLSDWVAICFRPASVVSVDYIVLCPRWTPLYFHTFKRSLPEALLRLVLCKQKETDNRDRPCLSWDISYAFKVYLSTAELFWEKSLPTMGTKQSQSYLKLYSGNSKATDASANRLSW